MATFKAPSSPVHLSLRKNQAHVAISIRLEHPQGHKAGAGLVCRALSCFKHLPCLPRSRHPPISPLGFEVPHVDGMEKCGLKQFLSSKASFRCNAIFLLGTTNSVCICPWKWHTLQITLSVKDVEFDTHRTDTRALLNNFSFQGL